MKLVGEFITRSTATRTLRASALNHELRYHPMKRQPIVKIPLFLLARLLIGKFFGSFRQSNKILNRLRRFFFEQTNHNIALRSFKNCVSSCGSAHQFFSPKYIFIVHDPSSHAPPAPPPAVPRAVDNGICNRRSGGASIRSSVPYHEKQRER